MSQSLDVATGYGFFLSDIFSRYFQIEELNAEALVNGCKDFSELLVKLSKHFDNISTCTSLAELKQKMFQTLIKEVEEFKGNICSMYFTDYHKIQQLFSALDLKKIALLDRSKNTKEDSISRHRKILQNSYALFTELKAIEFCKNFNEIRSLIIRDSGLEKYFDVEIGNSIAENDYFAIYTKVMKNFYEYFTSILKEKTKNHLEESHLQEILCEEASIFSLETILKFQKSYREVEITAKMLECIPSATQVNLKKLEGITDSSELLACFGFTEDRFSESSVDRQKEICKKSFDNFNDLSVIYSYFKLKEILINEIIYEGTILLNKIEARSNEIQ